MLDTPKERKELLEEIKTEFPSNCDIVSLIYNNNCEIDGRDIHLIKKAIRSIRLNNGILIINGVGGCANSGRELSTLLRKKFHKSLYTIIPNNACSSLVYTVLISHCLLVGERSFISPLDPIFKYKDRTYRAVKNITNFSNPKIRELAIKHCNNCLEFVSCILNHHGCIIINPGRLNFPTLTKIVKYLIAQKSHSARIYHEDMRKMKFETIVYKKDSPFWKNVSCYLSLVNKGLSKNTKFIVETAKKSYVRETYL